MVSRENLYITATLKPVMEGAVFDDYPPHVTIIPPFKLDANMRPPLNTALRTFIGEQKPVKIVGQQLDFLGENNDIRARLVGTAALSALHIGLLDIVVNRFRTPVDPTWAGANYNPHVSYKELDGIDYAEVIELQGLQLFQKISDRSTGKNKKIVRAVYPFGGA